LTYCFNDNNIIATDIWKKAMNPLINLMHLKFFCDAVTFSSISEAAKRNYVTQSAVSQAIAKLEQILGA
jgi:LysR family transcriptional regulator, carnitine catabolism transcriptional activator